MPTIPEELAQDMAKAVPLYGESIEWNGLTLPCVSRDQPTALELQEEGGFIDGVNSAVLVAKSAFPGFNGLDPRTFPQPGAAVNKGRYQVKKVVGHKDPTAAQLILYLGSFDQ